MYNRLKRMINKGLFKWLLRYDRAAFVWRFNILRNILGFAPRVDWHPNTHLYKVTDASASLFITRKNRIGYYKEGVRSRLDFLRNEYFADLVNFSDGNVVIDVGANVGEFCKSLSEVNNLRVLAFEPEDEECQALRANLQGIISEVYDVPLWKITSELNFYPSNETGDSSLIPQNEKSQPVRVKCFAIDEILVKSSIMRLDDNIKLLKLEAEGAEPEILQGMKQNLGRVEYVSVDVGAERGFEKQSTLIAVQKILIEAGFEPVKFGLPRAAMLFQNTRIKGR